MDYTGSTDNFDRILAGLHGLPDVTEAGPSTIRSVNFIGTAQTFIVTTYRQTEQGDTIFLESVSADYTIRALELLRSGLEEFAGSPPKRTRPEGAPQPIIPPVQGRPLAAVPKSIERFLNECCTKKEDGYITASGLYRTYAQWAKREGEPVFSRHVISGAMIYYGYTYSRSRRIAGIQARTWEGIAFQKPHRPHRA